MGSPLPSSIAQHVVSRSRPSSQLAKHLFAVEHVRRMRGGSQPQLLRCSDGKYYVVKFQNNPQGTRILVNELLCALLADLLHLPMARPAIVRVNQALIDLTPALNFELADRRIPCAAGLCFGSLYPGLDRPLHERALLQAHDFPPRSLRGSVANFKDFLGMLVFDTWTGNTDGRQVIFARARRDAPFRAMMIDNGYCFNGVGWDFPNRARGAIYTYGSVYAQVRGLEDFEEWLAALETRINNQSLARIARQIPPEWYAGDTDSLERLLNELDLRRKRIHDLLWFVWRSRRQWFPNWKMSLVVAKTLET